MITRSRAAEAAAKRTESSTRNGEEQGNDFHLPANSLEKRQDKGNVMEQEKSSQRPSINRDRASIALLVLLYFLQGIPVGLAGAMPILLQSRKVAYKDQATFSLVVWPFSMKLLWAPIVDTVFFSRFGRRKSWLVPLQCLIGIFMLILSKHIEEMLDDNSEEGPNIVFFTVIFFCLTSLAAFQDIAVDGWALTLFSRENVGYASACDNVGHLSGFFVGNVVFIALSSANFCNRFLRTEPLPDGVVTFSGFFYFWGIVFLVATMLVGLFKSEKSEQELYGEESVKGIVDGYKTLMRILRCPSILRFVTILLTVKVGFSAADSVTDLKLVEAGVPKENFVLLSIPMIPIQIVLPLYISRYTAGPRPLDVFLKIIPYRLFMGVVLMIFVWWAKVVRGTGEGPFPMYFYIIFLLVFTFYQVTLYTMSLAIMAFNARISDPRVGGTYLTLLNTLNNLGGNWCQTLALWLVDGLTWTSCLGATTSGLHCSSRTSAKDCTEIEGVCQTRIDGYYVESIVCVVFGILWLRWKGKQTRALQDLPEYVWRCY